MSETTEHGGGAVFPYQPTEAMLDAARDWSVAKYGIGVGNKDATGCWQAMWEAASREAGPATPPTRGDQAEVARLKGSLRLIKARTYSQVRDCQLSPASVAEIFDIATAALSPTSSAEPQAAAPVGELRAKLKDAALKYFMVGDRIMISIDAAIAALAAAPVTGDRETAGVELKEGARVRYKIDGTEGTVTGIIYHVQLGDPSVPPPMADWLEAGADDFELLTTPPSGGGDHAVESQVPDGGVGS